MSKKKLKTFNAQFKIDVFTDIQIEAENLEDAVAKAREYGVTDVIEIPGGHIDSEINLTGVYE